MACCSEWTCTIHSISTYGPSTRTKVAGYPHPSVPARVTELNNTTQDDYKIAWFAPGNNAGLDGQRLRDSAIAPTNRNRNLRVSDSAPHWHFEQTVLKNMRGAAGEQWPNWEHDLAEGEDVIGAIMEGPDAAQRMELELSTRLGAGDDGCVRSHSSPTSQAQRFSMVIGPSRSGGLKQDGRISDMVGKH